METNHRINSIDIARLFAAILVIAIHTQAIMWLSDRANGSIQILTRVAVPFFFCTSGYFLQKGYVRKDCSAISGTLLKLIKVYVLYRWLILPLYLYKTLYCCVNRKNGC